MANVKTKLKKAALIGGIAALSLLPIKASADSQSKSGYENVVENKDDESIFHMILRIGGFATYFYVMGIIFGTRNQKKKYQKVIKENLNLDAENIHILENNDALKFLGSSENNVINPEKILVLQPKSDGSLKLVAFANLNEIKKLISKSEAQSLDKKIQQKLVSDKVK